MTPVSLSLPANLLRSFRAMAEDMLVQPTDRDDSGWVPLDVRAAYFHETLVYAVAEAMRAYPSGSRMEAPPATLVPVLEVHSAVPEAAADFVRQLAAASKLTPAQAWHRVVLEFCKQKGPGREIGPEEVRHAKAG